MKAFWEVHLDAEKPLKAWRALMRQKKYQTPHEVKADFSAVDFLKDGRAVFDIGGNKYRLVVTIRYEWQTFYIGHVLTHSEYDRMLKNGAL